MDSSRTRAFELLEKTAADWGLPLAPAQIDALRLYLERLLEGGEKANLTAELDPQKVLLRHIADGLAAARILKEFISAPEPVIADVGSGAGFVGIALKIVLPAARVTLIEPAQKRYDFLNLVILKMGIPGLKIMRKKMPQDAGTLAETFDFVLERALAPLPEAATMCWPLPKPGGFFAAYQSEPPDAARPELKRRLDLLSARLVKSVPYRLPEEDRDRYLSFFQKPAQEMN